MKRLISKLVVVNILLGILLPQFFLMDNVFARYQSQNQTSRLSGSDRYKTAVAISQNGWDQSTYAVLARGDDFSDALCAGPLAAKYDAPILLTSPGKLNEDTLTELKRLGVSHVFVIGGAKAVALEIEAQLKDEGIGTVERIKGSNRYETSAKIAEKIGTSSEAAIVTGADFADALSISPVAAMKRMPILMTERDKLPGEVKEYIDKSGVDRTYVIGGTKIISDGVYSLLPNPTRLRGADRYETNVEVMKNFRDIIDFRSVYLAVGYGPRGNEFADALAGSALAGKANAPLILVYSKLPESTIDYIRSALFQDTKVTTLGGLSAVPQSVVENLVTVLNGTDFVVRDVKAVTDYVDQRGGETLRFTLNQGTEMSIEDLEEAGYSVEFQATHNVFVKGTFTSFGGELRPDLADAGRPAGEKFNYKVVIYRDGYVVAESNLKEVSVFDYSKDAAWFVKAGLTFGAKDENGNQIFVESQSHKLVVGETAYIENIKVALLDGQMTRLDYPKRRTASRVSFSSANKGVAMVDENGKVTPVAPGSTVLTLKSGIAKYEIPIMVVGEKRMAVNAVSDKGSIKMVNGVSMELRISIRDQYGDPFPGYRLDMDKTGQIENSNGHTIARMERKYPLDGITEEDGILKVNALADSYYLGNGMLEVTDNGLYSPGGVPKVIGTIPVNVGLKEGYLGGRILETEYAGDDLRIDVNDPRDNSITLIYREYDSSNRFIRRITPVDSNEPEVRWSVTSSKNDVASAALDSDGYITVKALSAGTATISMWMGGIREGSVTVTVEDGSTKVISASMEDFIFTERSYFPRVLNTEVIKPANIKLNVEDIVIPVYVDGKVEYRLGDEKGEVVAVAKVRSILSDKAGGNSVVVIAPDWDDGGILKVGKMVDGKFVDFERNDWGQVIVTLYRPNEKNIIVQRIIPVN